MHVKRRKNSFSHPGIEHPLIKILENTAIICGATGWAKVVVMSQGMADWISQYVDMSAGIPCERTFKNIFDILKPEILEKSLQEVSALIREKTPQEVISFQASTYSTPCTPQHDCERLGRRSVKLSQFVAVTTLHRRAGWPLFEIAYSAISFLLMLQLKLSSFLIGQKNHATVVSSREIYAQQKFHSRRI